MIRMMPGRQARRRLATGLSGLLLLCILPASMALLSAETGATRDSSTGEARFREQVAHYPHAPVAAAVMRSPEGEWRQTGDRPADTGDEALFEIGSLSKLFTALLLADMIEAGEVDADSTLSELLAEQAELSGRVGDITLASLASHTSGLPRLAIRGPMLRRMILQRSDPYAGATREEIFRALAGFSDDALNPEGEFEYSNFGMAVLGQALAEVAGQSYETLLRERILEPLGMHDTRFTRDALEDEALQAPHGENLRATDNWRMDAYNPAGGLVSSPADMGRFLAAVMDSEQHPALRRSLEPLRHDEEGTPVGAMGWFLGELDGQPMIWHNGRTGGYASFLAWLPEQDRGLVLLSNASHDIDAPARSLLMGEETLIGPQASLFWTGFYALMLVVAPLGVFGRRLELLQTLVGQARHPRGWLNGLGALFVAVFVLGICWLFAPWQTLPQWLFWLSVLLTVALAGTLVQVMRHIPMLPTHNRRRALGSFLFEAFLLALLIGLLLG